MKVSFGIEEEQKKGERKKDWGRTPLIPTGKLVLRLHCYRDEFRSKWSDGKRNKIEDHIPLFIEEMERLSLVLEKESIRRKEEERLWEIRKEKEREEKKKVDELEDILKDYQYYRDLKEMLQAMKELPENEKRLSDEMMDWSEAYLERENPLKKGFRKRFRDW